MAEQPAAGHGCGMCVKTEGSEEFANEDPAGLPEFGPMRPTSNDEPLPCGGDGGQTPREPSRSNGSGGEGALAAAVDALLDKFRVSDLVHLLAVRAEQQRDLARLESKRLGAMLQEQRAAPMGPAIAAHGVKEGPLQPEASVVAKPFGGKGFMYGDAVIETPVTSENGLASGVAENTSGDCACAIKAPRTSTSVTAAASGKEGDDGQEPRSFRDAVLSASSMVTESVSLPLVGKKFPPHQFFADAETLKDSMRNHILHPYDVTQLYYEKGISKRIASSPTFEMLTTFVIAFNIIWISIDTDVNEGKELLDKHFVFIFAEFAFFAFFVFEWAVRFGAFRRKLDCLSDTWFVFDTILVLLMVVDTVLPLAASEKSGKTSMLRLIRLVKITRMARVARILRRFPELGILIKGMSVAARSVVSTLCLLVVLLYVFSMAFRQLTSDTEVGKLYFRSVPFGMKTLMFEAAFPDNGDIVDALGDHNAILAILAVVFLVLAALTLMNMLIGVLCEVIGVVADVEKDRMKVKFVKERIADALKENNMPISTDILIGKAEFQELLTNPVATKAIREVGVDPVGLVDACDLLFSGHSHKLSKTELNQGLTFGQFIELILDMNSSNASRVKDIIDLRKVVLQRFDDVDLKIEEFKSRYVHMSSTQMSKAGVEHLTTLASRSS